LHYCLFINVQWNFIKSYLRCFLRDSLFRISHAFRFVNSFFKFFFRFLKPLVFEAKKKKSQSLKILFWYW